MCLFYFYLFSNTCLKVFFLFSIDMRSFNVNCSSYTLFIVFCYSKVLYESVPFIPVEINIWGFSNIVGLISFAYVLFLGIFYGFYTLVFFFFLILSYLFNSFSLLIAKGVYKDVLLLIFLFMDVVVEPMESKLLKFKAYKRSLFVFIKYNIQINKNSTLKIS